MSEFDEMMRTQDRIRREERDSVRRGLTEALTLLRKPTDNPEADRREIQARIIVAGDFLRRLY